MAKKDKRLIILIESEQLSNLLAEARRRGMSLGALTRQFIADGLSTRASLASNPLDMNVALEEDSRDWARWLATPEKKRRNKS